MNLGTYIRALLDFKERVVLAGFGTLEIKSPDRGEPPSGKRIDPPGKSVRFDSSYSKDDGLLASAVAEGEGIDRDEAQQRVLELIDAIKFALDRGTSYTLKETGTFIRDDDGKVRFQTSNQKYGRMFRSSTPGPSEFPLCRIARSPTFRSVSPPGDRKPVHRHDRPSRHPRDEGAAIP